MNQNTKLKHVSLNKTRSETYPKNAVLEDPKSTIPRNQNESNYSTTQNTWFRLLKQQSRRIYTKIKVREREREGGKVPLSGTGRACKPRKCAPKLHSFFSSCFCFAFFSLTDCTLSQSRNIHKIEKPKILYAARIWCGRAHVINVKRILHR